MFYIRNVHVALSKNCQTVTWLMDC